MRIVPDDHCRGRRWAVAPSRRTIFYRATLPAGDIAHAISDAICALARHDARHTLRLVPPMLDDDMAS